MPSRPQKEIERPAPRLYVVTPAIETADDWSLALESALVATDVAAVLLRIANSNDHKLIDRIRKLAAIVQDTDAALLLDGHAELVARVNADGAHLTGIENFSAAIGMLKPKWIAGAGGLETRHDAMLAAERAADYVMFGEPDAQDQRPGFDRIIERIEWWAEVFQIPCVGFAGSFDEISPLVEAGADFVAVGDFIFSDPRGAATAIKACAERLVVAERVG